METKVISARVPVDIANTVEKVCKQRGVTRSQYISDLVTNMPKKANGGLLEVNEPPEELIDMLSVVGGTAVGVLVWKILQSTLPDDRFTDSEKDAISLFGSIGAGLVGVLALDKIFKED